MGYDRRNFAAALEVSNVIPEFFALAVLGITFVSTLSARNQLKGLLAACVGLILAMVGLAPQSGSDRYTFGLLPLWDGASLVAVVVGLFGIPEVVDMATGGIRTALDIISV